MLRIYDLPIMMHSDNIRPSLRVYYNLKSLIDEMYTLFIKIILHAQASFILSLFSGQRVKAIICALKN